MSVRRLTASKDGTECRRCLTGICTRLAVGVDHHAILGQGVTLVLHRFQEAEEDIVNGLFLHHAWTHIEPDVIAETLKGLLKFYLTFASSSGISTGPFGEVR